MRVIGQDGQQGFSVSYWQPTICGATDAGGRAGAKQFLEVSVGPQSFPPSDRSERSFLHWQVNGRAGESSPDERRAVGYLEEGGVTPVEVKHQLAPAADDGQGLHARYTGCRIEYFQAGEGVEEAELNLLGAVGGGAVGIGQAA